MTAAVQHLAFDLTFS